VLFDFRSDCVRLTADTCIFIAKS